MKKYAWAQNREKLERAIGALGADATEEAIKARYIALAGLVLTDSGETLIEETSIETEEESPKKSKKK